METEIQNNRPATGAASNPYNILILEAKLRERERERTNTKSAKKIVDESTISGGTEDQVTGLFVAPSEIGGWGKAPLKRRQMEEPNRRGYGSKYTK